jgi:hypothetical protein
VEPYIETYRYYLQQFPGEQMEGEWNSKKTDQPGAKLNAPPMEMEDIGLLRFKALAAAREYLSGNPSDVTQDLKT